MTIGARDYGCCGLWKQIDDPEKSGQTHELNAELSLKPYIQLLSDAKSVTGFRCERKWNQYVGLRFTATSFLGRSDRAPYAVAMWVDASGHL